MDVGPGRSCPRRSCPRLPPSLLSPFVHSPPWVSRPLSSVVVLVVSSSSARSCALGNLVVVEDGPLLGFCGCHPEGPHRSEGPTGPPNIVVLRASWPALNLRGDGCTADNAGPTAARHLPNAALEHWTTGALEHRSLRHCGTDMAEMADSHFLVAECRWHSHKVF